MFNVYEEDRSGKQKLLFSNGDRATAETWLDENRGTLKNVKKGVSVAYVTPDRLFKVGDIVRFSDGFCSDGEKELFLIVLEDRTNGTGERYLVGTINHTNTLGHSETVFADMIEHCNSEQF